MIGWRTNEAEARDLYERADAIEWERRDFELADRIRAMADRLMQNPDQLYVPF